jgi:hypothetical protein
LQTAGRMAASSSSWWCSWSLLLLGVRAGPRVGPGPTIHMGNVKTVHNSGSCENRSTAAFSHSLGSPSARPAPSRGRGRTVARDGRVRVDTHGDHGRSEGVTGRTLGQSQQAVTQGTALGRGSTP